MPLAKKRSEVNRRHELGNHHFESMNQSVSMVKIANIAGTNSEAIGASSDDIINLGSFCIDCKGIPSVSSKT